MTLPDDDGTQEAEVATFKLKRRVKLGISGVLMVGVVVTAIYYVNGMFPVDTTMEEELGQVRWCAMDTITKHLDRKGRVQRYSSLDKPCMRVMIKLLRRLVNQPKGCDQIAKKIAHEPSWERQNRLLQVLMRYRRAQYPDDVYPSLKELRRQQCVEDSVVAIAQRWHKDKSKNPRGLIPGVAEYNVRFLRHLRFAVTNTYVLRRVKLSRPAARRLAARVLGQYRSLNRGASTLVRPAIKKLFEEVFFPMWVKLGKPKPVAK